MAAYTHLPDHLNPHQSYPSPADDPHRDGDDDGAMYPPLDPNDPLHHLLIHPGAHDDQDLIPPPTDWAQLSASLWAATDGSGAAGPHDGLFGSIKPDPGATASGLPPPPLDLFSLPMDLDMDPFGLAGAGSSSTHPNGPYDALGSIDPLHLSLSGSPASLFSGMPHTPLDASFASAPSFPYTPDGAVGSGAPGVPGRRLSVTSSSSSSGASLSPVLDHASVSSASSQAGDAAGANLVQQQQQQQQMQLGALAPEELLRIARQLAAHATYANLDAQRVDFTGAPLPAQQQAQAKLPIPRLRPHPGASPVATKASPASTALSPADSSGSSRAGSPAATGATTPTTSVGGASPPALQAHAATNAAALAALVAAAVPPHAPAPGTNAPGAATAAPAGARPKTDHTAIERRYRTNLNARIQALKAAVPALRVLEEHGAAFGDVVDERGCADGVRVPRKVSKANVLGKAVEYIRVLKNREGRLARERDAIKGLLAASVAGGAHLLQRWEAEWAAQHGGPETDEIGAQDGLFPPGAGDDEDEDDEEEDGPARKKARTAGAAKAKKAKAPAVLAAVPPATAAGAASPATLEASNGQPEKRKRGRPRKNPLPIASDAMQTDAPVQQQQPQVLLAAFAFFSFFSSPLTAKYSYGSSAPASHPAHHGSVVGHHAPASAHAAGSVGLHDVVQVVHVLVSLAVFCSIVVPWLPAALRKSSLVRFVLAPFSVDAPPAPQEPAKPARPAPLERALSSASSDSLTSTTSGSDDDGASSAASRPPRNASARARAALAAALDPGRRGAHDEAAQLHGALGTRPGVRALLRALCALPTRAARPGGRNGLERRQLEQRAWVRLAELLATGASDAGSTAARVHVYLAVRARISPFAALPADLATLALVLRPLARARANALWTAAAHASVLRAHERLALDSLALDDAAARLRAMADADDAPADPERTRRTPLGALGAQLVRERLRRHAARLFVRAVRAAVAHGGAASDADEDADSDGDDGFEAGGAAQREEQERSATVRAGKSAGGALGALAELFERVWETGTAPAGELDVSMHEDGADDVRALLRAVVLLRRVFPALHVRAAPGAPSLVVSPAGSGAHGGAAEADARALRRALAAAVFERDTGFGIGVDDEEDEDEERVSVLGEDVEDARDRAVDMLMERDRRRTV